jgi:hypothetical protein
VRPRLVTAVFLVAIGVLAARPAAAETRPPGGGAYIDDTGDPTATATQVNAVPGEGGGGGGTSPCTWSVWIEDDFEFAIWETEGVRQYSQTGRWLERRCETPSATAGPPSVEAAILPEGGQVDPAALALDALESVSVPGPIIGTSPTADALVVRVPTWLWVDGDWWRPYEATATAGRVTSTVVARPTQTSWVLGDGKTRTCSGSGVAWQPGLAETASNCTHTYTSSSAGQPNGTFELSATVELAIDWTSNTGQGGTLPAISRTSTVAVQVGEIQAIGTG